ncbi:hypothetical protein Daus18300_011874 [Diaporthe australafricana]|uniref:Cell surface protein n=1 Tax=Diaporthe australafricana TaxID=127596 RepID=A0ABR3W4V4_9PEZI
MSSIGQKIKDALTGHHENDKSDVKTPDVDAPGAFPHDEPSTKHHDDHNKLTKEHPGQTHQHVTDDVERGAQHHTGHSHHDPVPETQQATSDAGNYPYWGDLPREGGSQVHRSGGPSTGATEQHGSLSKDSSLATGALAAGAGAGTAGAGYLATRDSKNEDITRANAGTRAEPIKDTRFDNKDDTHRGAEATGLAGATYLATRDKAHADDAKEKKPTPVASNAPAQQPYTSKPIQHTETTTSTQKPVEAATPTKMTSGRDNDSHRKEEEALAAGAGAAGLAGAGYYASKRGDKEDPFRDIASHSTQGGLTQTSHPTATSASHHEPPRDIASHGTQGGLTQTSHPTTTSAGRHDPVTDAQKATSAAGNYPYFSNEQDASRSTKNTGLAEAATPSKTTSSGDNDTHRREQALATGAGATGLAGAGYIASRKLNDREDEKQFGQVPGQNVTGAQTSDTGHHHTHGTPGHHHDPEDQAKRATSGAGNYPHWDNDKQDSDRNRELAAAGVGGAGLAGAGLLASNRSDERRDDPRHNTRETTLGAAAPASLAQRDTTSRQVDPSTTSGGIHNTVVGAGSSEYSSSPRSPTSIGAGHQTQTSAYQTQPAAQAAAKQAWNKQESAPSSSVVDDTSRDNKRSDMGYAAAGTAFGAGAAGLAANYGQGKEHENNPRTNESEKVAERALGSDGKPHAPSSTHGLGSGTDHGAPSGLTSGIGGLTGQSGSTGAGSKVLHKCDNCGHDNDISRYFSKDAIFRSQQ